MPAYRRRRTPAHPAWQPELGEITEGPGVYLFRDARERILYIGKALNLRRRMASYYHRRRRQPAKLRRLVAWARGVTIYETGSELEALLLESRLLKQATPPFNQLSTQYASLPFVKLTLRDPFPRLLLTREYDPDGSYYLGPFPHVDIALVVFAALQRLFPLRTCETPVVPGVLPLPCAAFHLHKCAAPCVGHRQAAAYQRHIEDILALLGRGRDAVMQRLQAERQRAAAAMLYERAGHLHNILCALDQATVGRPLTLVAVASRNLVVLMNSAALRMPEVFLVRHGLFSTRVALCGDADDAARLSDALTHNYLHADSLVTTRGAAAIDELRIVASWLHRTRGRARWLHVDPDMSLADALEVVMRAISGSLTERF